MPKHISISKVLIANRGEIAVRIMQTCHEMGITTVAVFSEADRNALFVQEADEAIAIGGLQATESYLDQNKIIEAAIRSGAEAIHPGYGFLAENASFAKRCDKEGIIFIGPNAKAIEAMGDKKRAKEIMEKHGVPVVPGYDGKDQSLENLTEQAKKVGFPLLLKATAGGGGKGMRIVREAKSLKKEIEGAKREAKAAFGDDTLIIEKYFKKARHIEFQIFGDRHGHALHLFERECSIQRRYQKIIEESPSPVLDDQLRTEMADAAVKAAKAINYDNAGTVEFILDEKKNFYFLEVNTRLQVEHPVTEMITDLDLVRLQIECASGLPFPFSQDDITSEGHAVECRLYAEDPGNNFLPVTGNILHFIADDSAITRFDTGVESGAKIDIHYDPMIAKVITYGETRQEAIQKMIRTLSRTVLLGLTTNKDFLCRILRQEKFILGDFDTQFLERHPELAAKPTPKPEQKHQLAIAATLYNWGQREENRKVIKEIPSGWRNNFYQPQFDQYSFGEEELVAQYSYCKGDFQFQFGDQQYSVKLIEVSDPFVVVEIDGYQKIFALAAQGDNLHIHDDNHGTFTLKLLPRFPEKEVEKTPGSYNAPMPGEVVKVLVKTGDKVKSGDGLVVLSSMKMENTIEAFEDGVVEEVFVEEKGFVEADSPLVKIFNKISKS